MSKRLHCDVVSLVGVLGVIFYGTAGPRDGDVAVAIMRLEPQELHFDQGVNELVVTVCNVGTWGCWCHFTGGADWLILPADEHLAAGECEQPIIRVDRQDLPEGDYESWIDAEAYYSGPRMWPQCMSGPGVAYPFPECYPLDLDQDGDVDLEDYAVGIEWL